jgi:hypothetical protein
MFTLKRLDRCPLEDAVVAWNKSFDAVGYTWRMFEHYYVLASKFL